MVHCTFNRKLDPLGNLIKRLKFLSPNKDAIIMYESLYMGISDDIVVAMIAFDNMTIL